MTNVGSTTIPADRPIVAGSRPAASHAARSASSRGPNSARSLRSSTYQLQVSACRTANRSILGPLAPIMIGMRPGRGPTGRCSRSRAAWNVPSKSARPCRSSGTMISTASSNRPNTWSSGSPKAWAWRPACPDPRPNTNRPPLISSMVSTALAVIPGFRCRAERTHVPTLTRDVAAATAPVRAAHSQKPVALPSGGRHSSSSTVQTVSKPISSARTAMSRISVQRAVAPSTKDSPIGSTRPISRVRTVPPACGRERRSGSPARARIGGPRRLPGWRLRVVARRGRKSAAVGQLPTA